MAVIEDAVNSQGISEDEFQEKGPGLPIGRTAPEKAQESTGFSLNLAWLRTPTGEGSIEDYIEHPLNFSKSRGLAQILRGVTGFFGNLKLAIVDIAVGAFNMLREGKAPANGQ